MANVPSACPLVRDYGGENFNLRSLGTAFTDSCKPTLELPENRD